MTTTTPRQTFRQTVAAVAALAKAKLPQAVNGRLESAVKLVLAHDVEPQADGSILVGSSTDPLKTYTLTGQACTCQDFERGQAPDGWCQHRIAAAIQKRVQALLPVVPEVVEPWPDNDPEPGPTSSCGAAESTAAACQPTAVSLPEARCSVNVHVTIAGRQVQVTLRGHDDLEVLARLETLLARYPAPASPQGQPQGEGDTPQCPTHGVLRKGKRGWFCPRQLDDGTWCKSKSK